jgi:hypothetical protein
VQTAASIDDEHSDAEALGTAAQCAFGTRIVLVSDDFVAYRGDADLHDGTVLSVHHEGDEARVIVRGGSGSQFEIGFSGVASLTQYRAEGMTLYAVAEMKTDPPLRRFVFTNWDDEDDASLELVARDVDCRPLSL